VIHSFIRFIFLTLFFDLLFLVGPGSFLLRPSDNSPGHYSLFFHINNTVQRFRIERRGSVYVMGGRCFDNLEAVVNRYRNEQIVEGHRLGEPFLKTSFETSIASFKTGEINNKSQDVYATLKESREVARKSKTAIIRGYLMKKSIYLVLLHQINNLFSLSLSLSLIIKRSQK